MSYSQVICLGEALVDRLGPIGSKYDFKDSYNDFLGGAPANVACGLAKLGIKSSFIGCLGNDLIGKNFLDLFNLCGVNTSALQIHETLPSRIVLVARDDLGERSFGGFLGNKDNIFADQNLDIDIFNKISPNIMSNASWLVTGTIPLATENSRKVTKLIVNDAIKYGLKIAIDVNWRPTFWNINSASDDGPDMKTSKLIYSFLESANLLKLSREEAFWFFNSDDPVQIVKSLSQKPNIIVTDGANPIKWLFGDICGQTNTLLPSNIVDTTGAGDSFLSGFIYKLFSNSSENINNLDINSMITFAAACGALVCQGAGAIDSQPSCLEVEKFLSSFNN